jgi:hypothetical protein
MQKTECLQNTPIDLSSIVGHYGDVWTQPAENLKVISQEYKAEEAFKKALSQGYFSQYTSYNQRDLIERVTDWQLNLLAKWLGSDLSLLPIELNELFIIPEVLLVERHGRTISPDLLRMLWYVLFLHHQQSLMTSQIKNILEIGSGYGSFARVIKAYHPSACVWLVDLPDSLVYAKTYLSAAYPDAMITVVDSPEISISDSIAHDFILVSVDESHKLFGRQFDLAVNIWSLGEMPNSWINYWFDLLQKHCQVDRLFLLNAFASPVTSQSSERTKQGNWLFCLDSEWEIKNFEINPEIHRCPFIRNFYTGASIYCQRIKTPEEFERIKKAAHEGAQQVLLEDWATIAMAHHHIIDCGRPETDIAVTPSLVKSTTNESAISVKKLLLITEYIGYPLMEANQESPLYRLWNDFRLNVNISSAMLLITYLAMVNKSEPGHRCSKEEMFLLEKLPECKLHEEYRPIAVLSNEPQIDYRGTKYFIQDACNLSQKYIADGFLEDAKELLARVAILAPQHGDCWHQLALLFEAENQIILATTMALHACKIYPGYTNYLATKEKLLLRLQKKSDISTALFRFSANISDINRDRMIRYIRYFPGLKQHEITIAAAGCLSNQHAAKYLKMIGKQMRSNTSEIIADALDSAASAYA